MNYIHIPNYYVFSIYLNNIIIHSSSIINRYSHFIKYIIKLSTSNKTQSSAFYSCSVTVIMIVLKIVI